jgi:hypothetical protein
MLRVFSQALKRVGSAGCSPGCLSSGVIWKFFGPLESGSDVLNGQDCIEVPVFAAWMAPDEHIEKSSLKVWPGECRRRVAWGKSKWRWEVCGWYFHLLDYVDRMRWLLWGLGHSDSQANSWWLSTRSNATQNDSWNIDSIMLDDVSTFWLKLCTVLTRINYNCCE